MTAHDEHHTHDVDWNTMVATLETEAEVHLAFLEQAAAWLADLRDESAPGSARRVLDVGSGPGVATCVLAHAFPQAETVAVDAAPQLLDRVRERAAAHGVGDRVTTREAELPDAFPTLGTADVVWSSQAVHHLGDQQAALRSLAGLLRPGGLLAVAEGGLPRRYLPRDFGTGRPGLQARLDALEEEAFGEMRTELPGAVSAIEDWPAMLAAAGLAPAGTRTFLVEYPAPAPEPVRRHLHDRLTRLREGLGDRLDAEDRAALDLLVDPDAAAGVLRRPDVFYLRALTVHAARAPR